MWDRILLSLDCLSRDEMNWPRHDLLLGMMVLLLAVTCSGISEGRGEKIHRPELVNDVQAYSFWELYRKEHPRDLNVQVCYAISLLRAQQINEAMSMLIELAPKMQHDWVLFEYLGGAFGAIARRSLTSPDPSLQSQ